MTRTGRNVKYAALLFALFFAAAGRTAAAKRSGSQGAPEDQFLDSKVPEFSPHNQTLLDGLWKIARGPAPFSFGFEKVLKRNLAESEVPDTSLSLHLKDKTVREILDALSQADARFTWAMDGPTVNVFPRAISGDPFYLLADAQVGGGDPHPPAPWTVTYHNLLVRQVINRLALHGGPCGIWIFGGASDFRAFGFFYTYLSCSKQLASQPKRPLEPPMKNSKP